MRSISFPENLFKTTMALLIISAGYNNAGIREEPSILDAKDIPPRFANLADDLLPPDLQKEPDSEQYGWWGLHYAPDPPQALDLDIDIRKFPGGVIPYLRSRMDPVFQASAPRKEEVVQGLELNVAPGSYGTAIVQLYALKDCKSVRVSIRAGENECSGAPVGIVRWIIYSLSSERPGYLVRQPVENPENIAVTTRAVLGHADNLKGRKVKELKTIKAAGELSDEEAKDLGRKRASLSYNPWHVSNISGSISQGSTQEVWAVFYVPEEAPLGKRFQRSLRIAPAGAPPTDIPITVNVEPFRLVAPRLACGFWYNGIQTTSEYERPGHNFQTDAFDMRAMGMNALGFAVVPIPYHHTKGLDLGPFEEAMKRLQQAGFATRDLPASCWYNYSWACFDSGYLMSEKLSPERIIETMQALDALCEKHPEWPDIIVCLTDELGPKESERLRRQNKEFFDKHPEAWPEDGQRLNEAADVARRIKELGLKNVKAAFISNRPQATETFLPFFGAGYANFGGLSQKLAEQARDYGCEFYTYNTWRSRMAFGYYNWKCSLHGSKGNLQWGYGLSWSAGEPFVLHVPGGKVIRHRIYHQMAEGIEDLRYINTLEEKIARHPGSEAAINGQRLLDEIASRLEVSWTYGPKAHESINFWKGEMADAYDEYRLKLAQAISALIIESAEPGDVDYNGTVNIFDLLELLKILSGSSPAAEPGDVDSNGTVNIFDLLELLKILSGSSPALEEKIAAATESEAAIRGRKLLEEIESHLGVYWDSRRINPHENINFSGKEKW